MTGHGALLDSRLLAEVYIELTGGAQAGLDLMGRDNDRDVSGDPQSNQKKTARQRLVPLASKITEEERAAHQAFLDELGDACAWRQPLN